MTNREKVLIISRYFPSEPTAAGERMRAFAWYLADTFSVDVLTAKIGYKKAEQEQQLGEKDIAVSRVYMPQFSGSLMGRLYSEGVFLCSVLLKSLFISRSKKVIISSPPFLLFFAAFFWKWIKRTPYILDIRDQYPESFVALGLLSKRNPIIWMLQKIESFGYHHASAIIVVSQSMKTYVQEIAPKTSIEIVYNGVDIEKHIVSLDEKTKDPFGLNKQMFTIIYTGTLGFSEQIQTLLDALVLLKKQHKDLQFRCLIIGDGSKKAQYELFVKEQKLSQDVLFTGRLPKEQADSLLQEADLAVCLKIDSELMTGAIPSKIFEYMFAKTPFILGIKGEAADIVKEHQAGIIQSATDSEQLAQHILWVKQHPEKALEFVRNGYALVQEQFNRKSAVEKILPLI